MYENRFDTYEIHLLCSYFRKERILGNQNESFPPSFGGNNVDSPKTFTFIMILESDMYFLTTSVVYNPHYRITSIVPFIKIPHFL